MLIVTKVHDTNCDICLHMSKHDRATFESFPDIAYQEVLLDDVINHNQDLTKFCLYQCLDKYATNSDYTIDLPVYVFLEKNGKYKGHLIGAATIQDLRSKIQECLNESPQTV